MSKSAVFRILRFRFGREVLLIGMAYMAYEVVRSLSAGRALDAFQNAELLVRAERALGIFAELNVQVAILSWQGLVDLLSLWYFWGHFPLIVAFAVWAFARQRPNYLWARNAIFAAGALGLVIYLAFPVAPPRLLPGAGFVDTLRDVFALQYEDSSLVNEFAAVPSLHQGFAIIVGVTLFRAIGGRRGVALMLALPTVMFVSIVATGNHWFLDAVFGAVVAGIGMLIAMPWSGAACRCRSPCGGCCPWRSRPARRRPPFPTLERVARLAIACRGCGSAPASERGAASPGTSRRAARGAR